MTTKLRVPQELRDMAISGTGRFREGTKSSVTKRQSTEVKKELAEHDLSSVRIDEKYIDAMRQHIVDIQEGRGMKNVYKKEYAKLAFDLLSNEKQCTTLRLISAIIGCSHATLYIWMTEQEDFTLAIAAGKSIQETHMGNVLLQGFKYARSVEYILANLHDWTQKKEERHGMIDLNKEIAERESFAAAHRATKRIDWVSGEIIDVSPMQAKVAQEVAFHETFAPRQELERQEKEDEEKIKQSLRSEPLPPSSGTFAESLI